MGKPFSIDHNLQQVPFRQRVELCLVPEHMRPADHRQAGGSGLNRVMPAKRHKGSPQEHHIRYGKQAGHLAKGINNIDVVTGIGAGTAAAAQMIHAGGCGHGGNIAAAFRMARGKQGEPAVAKLVCGVNHDAVLARMGRGGQQNMPASGSLADIGDEGLVQRRVAIWQFQRPANGNPVPRCAQCCKPVCLHGVHRQNGMWRGKHICCKGPAPLPAGKGPLRHLRRGENHRQAALQAACDQVWPEIRNKENGRARVERRQKPVNKRGMVQRLIEMVDRRAVRLLRRSLDLRSGGSGVRCDQERTLVAGIMQRPDERQRRHAFAHTDCMQPNRLLRQVRPVLIACEPFAAALRVILACAPAPPHHQRQKGPHKPPGGVVAT